MSCERVAMKIPNLQLESIQRPLLLKPTYPPMLLNYFDMMVETTISTMGRNYRKYHRLEYQEPIKPPLTSSQ